MGEAERCYRCGRVRCETCGGTGHIVTVRRDDGVVSHCPDCEGGWREAEMRVEAEMAGMRLEINGAVVADEPDAVGVMESAILGTDPAVLCPSCKEE